MLITENVLVSGGMPSDGYHTILFIMINVFNHIKYAIY